MIGGNFHLKYESNISASTLLTLPLCTARMDVTDMLFHQCAVTEFLVGNSAGVIYERLCNVCGDA
jgi:hypothetical protein